MLKKLRRMKKLLGQRSRKQLAPLTSRWIKVLILRSNFWTLKLRPKMRSKMLSKIKKKKRSKKRRKKKTNDFKN